MTLQKKVCMVGLFGTGKTCLVRQYVHSIFSTRYQSTVGVKIDRKVVDLDGTSVTLILWDLAGREAEQDINVNYLRGAHGILYVVDGTRRETCEQIMDLRRLALEAAGPVPSVVALNKSDLVADWALTTADVDGLSRQDWRPIRTSAKTGTGVEEAFRQLAEGMLAGGSA